MKKFTIELNAFKEKLEALDGGLKERFHSIEIEMQRLIRQTEEYNDNVSTPHQIQGIQNEFFSFKEWIRNLEELNQTATTQF